MEAYLKQSAHLFYKIEEGKVTVVNTEKKWIKSLATVPSIYANVVEVITKDDYEKAKKSVGL